MNPTISMSLSAHYVTQSSLFTSPMKGRLTDRRIRHYEKLGYYGQQAKLRAEVKEKAKKRKVLEEFIV